MTIFAYSDETIFKMDRLQDISTLGCGIFITKTEITREVTRDAMASLKSIAATNPSAVTVLAKTIGKGHFHATDDSNIAREELLKSISRLVKGELYVSYYNDWKVSAKEPQKNQKMYFDRCLSSSSIEFFNTMEEVNFVIEQRNGISNSSIEQWREAIYRMFEDSAYTLPSFKTFFPKITITIGDKNTPGLQVTDLLLWSINKSKSVPSDDRWIKMLKIVTSYHSEPTEKEKEHSGCYHINAIPNKPMEDYPYRYACSETRDELINAYLNIERFLRHIERADFHDAAYHLYDGFARISALLKQEGHFLSRSELETVGRIYIRLFDSLPIYANIVGEENWRILFHTKHIASLILAQGEIHLERTKNAILRWRYDQQQNGTLAELMRH